MVSLAEFGVVCWVVVVGCLVGFSTGRAEFGVVCWVVVVGCLVGFYSGAITETRAELFSQLGGGNCTFRREDLSIARDVIWGEVVRGGNQLTLDRS